MVAVTRSDMVQTECARLRSEDEHAHVAPWLDQTKEDRNAWLSRIRDALLNARKRPVHRSGKGFDVALDASKLQERVEQWAQFDRLGDVLTSVDIRWFASEAHDPITVTALPDGIIGRIADERSAYWRTDDGVGRAIADRGVDKQMEY